MNNVDLRELAVLDAVWRLKSVSSAAKDLGLSQPAVSNALGRLRRHFSDRLFVRTIDGMKPTPLADELMAELGGALVQIDNLLKRRHEFDPAQATRVFNIIMTDIGEIVFLPPLLRFLELNAPGITIRTKRLSLEGTSRALESGVVDLVVSYLPDLQVGVHQQRLFTTNYVCIVRRDHPTIGERLTKQQFLNASHAVTDAEGSGHYVVEKQLARVGVQSIGLRTTSFLALPAIVASSNMIATVPRPLVDASSAHIRVLDLPFPFPGLEIKQIWHERFDNDPSNRWLRNCCAGLFQK